MLHRFVIASATPRFYAINQNKLGGLLSLDIALPRNEKEWFEVLAPDLDKLFVMKLYYGHLFCHVLHHNYVVKKGVDTDKLQEKLLKIYDAKGLNILPNIMLGMSILLNHPYLSFIKNLIPLIVLIQGLEEPVKTNIGNKII